MFNKAKIFNPLSNEPPYAPNYPYPENRETDIHFPVTLSVYVYDETSYTVNVSFYKINELNDTLIGYINVQCEYNWSTASVLWNETIENESYSWYAIANDSEFENRSKTWIFFTKPLAVSNPFPKNQSIDVFIGMSCWYVDIDGPENVINWTIETSPNVGNASGYYHSSGNKSCPLSGLNYKTKYTVYVNATDTGSGYSINKTFWFITEEKSGSGGGGDGGGGFIPPLNQYPIAIITAPEIAYVNETIILFSNYSYDNDGYLIGYRWDFENDGVYDTDWIEDTYFIHKYSKPDKYTIQLQVKDNNDDITTVSHNITIIEIKQDLHFPIPIINGPYSGYTNENITFNSDSSYDPDGRIINYTWYFGDGNISYLKNPSHIYGEPGDYQVLLKITDNDNLSNATITKAVIIEKEIEPKEKERELPSLLIYIIMTSIIVTIILVILRLKGIRIVIDIDKTKSFLKRLQIVIEIDETKSSKKK